MNDEQMNTFHELAKKVLGTIQTASGGFYKGMTSALYKIMLDVMLDTNVSSDDWEDETERRFYKIFPYMDKRADSNG